MSESFHLYQLQKIDSQIYSNKLRITQITTKINENSELLNSKQIMEETINKFNEAKFIVNKLNDEVESKKIKINQCNSDLYSGSVKNPKELQDLQMELSLLKKQLEDLEENLLEKMIELDEIEMEKNKLVDSFHLIESKAVTTSSMLIGEKKELLANQSRLEVEREAMTAQIHSSLIGQYEILRSERNGIAVAMLQDNSCSACGAVLSPSECQSSRDSNIIFHCPTCKRIIYGG